MGDFSRYDKFHSHIYNPIYIRICFVDVLNTHIIMIGDTFNSFSTQNYMGNVLALSLCK